MAHCQLLWWAIMGLVPMVTPTTIPADIGAPVSVQVTLGILLC